ncbi:MAG: sodium:proton antiporter [Vicinamibacterales bacterium]|jgi:CPA1 family monovalent cation:H+ antiporter|nr:sodium:proton antiporter [Acidobacteriota bacterium]MDP6371109.1 sodium:proton antiporter [Vicinamibacterales bacterium]MDP6609274.1 sodium:proton antiporter [Vicinamibacterales bacterium]HAK54143.1 sodium:proton antiporter [Acidobacteriota bacterium]|tara:strand:- start:5062 stop:6327 length:1266 start_codon:yes stop_codon:yes gene_type:complete
MGIESVLNLAAFLVTMAAVFGYLNHRWLKLPHTVGLVVIALFASLTALLIDALIPSLGFGPAVRGTLTDIDLYDTLMKGMLGFLLFAGALHVDLDDLWQRRWAISILATVGILTSTVIVGAMTYAGWRALGFDVGWLPCLTFGALISPTDPIAVLSILKRLAVPPTLEAKIAGESLFNDGVGVVVFTVLAGLGAGGAGAVDLSPLAVVELVVTEAVGGIVLGLGAGYLTYRLMRPLDEHNLEVMMTLALVMATTAIAVRWHLSGPLAVVVAGLFIGNHGAQFAMSANTRDHIERFWSLLDEILNSVLFLIIGFEVVALSLSGAVVLAVVLAIPVVLAARFVAVAGPITLLRRWRTFTPGAIPVLTWGGLRGGISVALVLSLPPSPVRELLLAATYGVVIFSIVVQGLTIERVVRRSVAAAS